MKTIVLAAMALLVAGCQDKKEMQQLQARVAVLESNSAALNTAVQSVAEDGALLSNQWSAFAVTNSKHMDMLWDRTKTNLTLITSAREMIWDMNGRMIDIESMTNRIPKAPGYTRTQPVPQFVPPPAQTYIQGVPSEIYKGIVADAERKWPSDFDMQVFVIKEQVQAYQKLHPE